MLEEWSAFSSKPMTSRDLARIMEHLGAVVDESTESWKLQRGEHYVLAMLANEDIDDLDDELLEPIAELDGNPLSRVAFLFPTEIDHGEYEIRMVRAVAIALSERFPIVLDDHAGEVERIKPPRGFKG